MSAELLPKTHALLDILPEAPIDDARDLPELMQAIADQLPHAGLGHVVPGLLGYKAVTEEVLQGIETNLFNYPEKMETTMPVFAQLLFDAFRTHFNDVNTGTSAWKPLFDLKNPESVPPGLKMYDFMQSHILADLYKALIRTNTQEKHWEDYSEKINLALTQVGWKILYEYVELHPAIKSLKIPDLTMKFILSEMYRSRDTAWAAFELHSQGKATEEQLDAILINTAHKRMLSTKPLVSHALRLTTRIPDGYKVDTNSNLAIPE